MMIRKIPPPAMPIGLPSGDERGGIFAAPWAPEGFYGMVYPQMPIDSSISRPVPMATTPGTPMRFGSLAPRNVPMSGAEWEMVDRAPRPIGPYRPSINPAEGGIFATSGLGGCGCDRR